MIEEIHQPRRFRQALRLKARHGAAGHPVVGGTDLMVKVRAGRTAPRVVIDLSATKSKYIRRSREWIRLGATATAGDFLRLPWARAQAPALWEACRQIGGPQIQNGATFAGNLANASPAADTPPVLMVLGAQVGVESLERGLRWVPVEEFFFGPGKTALQEDELIREIRIPRTSLHSMKRGASNGAVRIVSEFFKMGPRRAQVISVCCLAGWAKFENASGIPRLVALRLAAGGVAPTVKRLAAAEHRIAERGLDPETLREAADLVHHDIVPISDVRGSAEYKALLTRNFALTFLESLAAVADERRAR
jgi:CO/xanthine dehydrogenase FAD-binding subunit